MITINHEYYVSLEVAKLAKEAGFNWKVKTQYLRGEFKERDDYRNYNNPDWFGLLSYSAPTQAVLQRWLREVKGISVEVCHVIVWVEGHDSSLANKWTYNVCYLNSNESDILSSDEFDTFEAAFEEGLQKCLTLLIDKQ